MITEVPLEKPWEKDFFPLFYMLKNIILLFEAS
jgi:hypothetical protein